MKRNTQVFVCGIPDGPYRYGGFYFEIHPYCGPSQLLPNGDPINKEPSRAFLKMWEVFRRLDQAGRDLYSVKFREQCGEEKP